MTKPVKAVLIGAGVRGRHVYGPYAQVYPEQLQFVAVAEPDPGRRRQFALAHNIPAEQQYVSWEDLLARGQIADVLFNMTQDQMHYPSTLAALDAGYDVLLEKPMTTHLEETVHLVQTAERQGQLLQVCHVLRYTPFFRTLHDIVASGRLGEIVMVEHRENVAYWHMAHSFVRGNWCNLAEASPMILAKCCHDLDILYWNMGQPVQRLQSFGSLLHFRPENAPPGATARCTDGCPAAEQCPFDARRIYLDPDNNSWPVIALTDDLSMPARQRALETGPYGRCVYQCHNDVVDHQTVNMEFANGATVVLLMHGHSHEEGRTMRYDGTRATLRGKFGSREGWIEIHDHLTNRCDTINIPAGPSGHGGGDFGIVHTFLQAVGGTTGVDEQTLHSSLATHPSSLTTARESLESHLLAFAAEESRLQRRIIDMEQFRQHAERRAAA